LCDAALFITPNFAKLREKLYILQTFSAVKVKMVFDFMFMVTVYLHLPSKSSGPRHRDRHIALPE